MKTRFIFFILFIFCSSVSAQQLAISGHLKGLKEGEKIYLLYPLENSRQQHTDSTVIRNGGAFSFLIKRASLNRYILMGGQYMQELLLTPGKAVIIGDSAKVRVSGNAAADALQNFQQLMRSKMIAHPIVKEGAAIEKKYSKEAIKKAELENDTVFIKAMTAALPLMLKKRNTIQQLATAMSKDRLAKAGKNDYLVPLLLIDDAVSDYPVDSLEYILKRLNKDIRQSAIGREAANTLKMRKATEIGSYAPLFSQSDSTGKQVSLKEFRGKYVLIDFWASWCAPCRAENPNVVKAYQQFKEKGLTILGISLDNERSNWLEAIQKDGLSWTHVSDLKGWANAAAKMYNVKGIPANYLLDPDGKIIAKDLRGDKLKSKLEEVFLK